MADVSAGPLATWRGLADPNDPNTPRGATCDIDVGQLTWEHVLRDHIQSEAEPWAEWFTPALVDALKAPGGPSSQSVRQALDLLGKSIRESLGRPLVLVYQVIARAGHAYPTWILILPTGAKAVVRSPGPVHHALATCYFPGVACREMSPEHRWLKVVKKLVSQYHAFRPGVGVQMPPPSREFSIKGRVRTQVRFVTPQSWGFETALEGYPWRGRPPSWDAAGSKPQPPAQPRLRPRRRKPSEGGDHA